MTSSLKRAKCVLQQNDRFYVSFGSKMNMALIVTKAAFITD